MSDLQETTVFVSGLNCGGCVGTLTRRALGIYGVVHVDVDLVPGGPSRVTLRHCRSIDGSRVSAGLVDCGYPLTQPVPA